MTTYDYLIVGAGFTGATLAERLASQRGKRVLVIDKRSHIGGNAYDTHNAAGLLVHRYGPHIFHTNSARVFHYLSQFTTWRAYEHRVLTSVEGKRVPMPINLDTLNELYGTNHDSASATAYLESVRINIDRVRNSRDVVVRQVGTDLYEKLYRNYTKKQWGVEPDELAPEVCGRIPVRTDRDDRYFTDTYQAIPADGYTALFAQMLDHDGIDVLLSTAFDDVRQRVDYRHLVYTGPVDEFFHYQLGRLPYRSLRFREETVDAEQVQPVATVNYPNDHDYTRVTEMKHITGQSNPQTALIYEYPSAEGDPFYPVPTEANKALYARYASLAKDTPNVTFAGRLGSYQYLNMDQAVGQALHVFDVLESAHGSNQGEWR
ncbi:UDP-galactopyranose mutase [Alicyclobacillus sp. ALC3]|uniref:UDP-galactopyranose mutase n=1 Tax=Alicyclobacillus sp. ALC3 TaxID=2796143 RepID=UPI0023795B68|nr:UDP-galactopyranose mutase [Alicyclobacillus sp. ALC3]WDL95295.1 UDP-galactopyranose mutase [Alicyclobacillus sp. ALC3]